MQEIRFQTQPIDAAAAYKELGARKDGAILSFIGIPREDSNGKTVSYLEYEVYEDMASKEMQKIVDQAFANWPITDCLVIHRYGKVDIGEASIFIGVSSPHRDEAFKAVRYIIDTIKKTVPVWKKEVYADGSSWISERS